MIALHSAHSTELNKSETRAILPSRSLAVLEVGEEEVSSFAILLLELIFSTRLILLQIRFPQSGHVPMDSSVFHPQFAHIQ